MYFVSQSHLWSASDTVLQICISRVPRNSTKKEQKDEQIDCSNTRPNSICLLLLQDSVRSLCDLELELAANCSQKPKESTCAKNIHIIPNCSGVQRWESTPRWCLSSANLWRSMGSLAQCQPHGGWESTWSPFHTQKCKEKKKHQEFFLVDGAINPSDKYAAVKVDHFPKLRGENKRCLSCHQPSFWHF